MEGEWACCAFGDLLNRGLGYVINPEIRSASQGICSDHAGMGTRVVRGRRGRENACGDVAPHLKVATVGVQKTTYASTHRQFSVCPGYKKMWNYISTVLSFDPSLVLCQFIPVSLWVLIISKWFSLESDRVLNPMWSFIYNVNITKWIPFFSNLKDGGRWVVLCWVIMHWTQDYLVCHSFPLAPESCNLGPKHLDHLRHRKVGHQTLVLPMAKDVKDFYWLTPKSGTRIS